jgi:cyanate permease
MALDDTATVRGASPGDGGPLPATSWPAVAMALVAGVLAACQVGKVIIGLPDVRTAFGMDLGTAGVVVSSYTFVAALLGALTGMTAERIGRERTLVASLAVLTLGAALGTAAWSVPALLASRVLEGFGFMGAVVAAPSVINARTGPGHRRLTLGIWGVYMASGQALVIALGPFALALGGWRALWGVNAVLLLACTVAAALVLGLPAPGRHPARRFVSFDIGRGTWLLAVAFGVYALQYLAVVGFLPSIYAAAGLSTSSAGALTAVVIAGNVVGNLAGGALLHRGVHAGNLMCVAALAMGLSVLVVYRDDVGLTAAVTAALVFTTVGGLIPASAYAALPAMAPTPTAVAAGNGVLVQASNTGSLIGPPAVGVLASATGTWAFSPAVLSSCAVIGLAAALVVRRLERRAAR